MRLKADYDDALSNDDVGVMRDEVFVSGEFRPAVVYDGDVVSTSKRLETLVSVLEDDDSSSAIKVCHVREEG